MSPIMLVVGDGVRLRPSACGIALRSQLPMKPLEPVMRILFEASSCEISSPPL